MGKNLEAAGKYQTNRKLKMDDLDHLSSHIAQQNARLIEARDRLNEFLEAVPFAIEKSQELMGAYANRADQLYAQLLDASSRIDAANEAIAEAAGHGVQQLGEGMDAVTEKAGLVLGAMVGLRDAVDGENGMSQKLQGIQNQFGEKLWILDKSITALSSLQISKLAQHQKAISAVQNIGTFAVAFGLGYAFKAWA